MFEKITRWYFSKESLPYWFVLGMDCVLLLVAQLSVFVFNHGSHYAWSVALPLVRTLLLCLPAYMVGFRLFHTYSAIMRYSSFSDLLRLSYAVLLGLAAQLCLYVYLVHNEWFVFLRFRDSVVSAALAILLMWSVRVLVKYLYELAYTNSRAPRMFIYGGDPDARRRKNIYDPTVSPYVLAGFVSDNPRLCRRMLMGLRVYANDESLAENMAREKATVLLVTPDYEERVRDNATMADRLIRAGVKICFATTREWGDEGSLKEVDIEDLLPRDKIEVDMTQVEAALRGRRVLITGAAGSIGSELTRLVAAMQPATLWLTDQAETPLHDVRLEMARQFPELHARTVLASITDAPRMEQLMQEAKPQYVFHAAAYKHVPMLEDNPGEALRNNVAGTRVMADLAVKHGVERFVMVSTDKAVNPTNVMGCSKRLCEIYVQSLDKAEKEGRVAGRTQFITTRFGNVLGSNGSVIPLFREQIKKGGPVTVTHPDIIRFFMLIPEACRLVLEAATKGKGGEIFVFDMGQPVRIADLARRMIALSGAHHVEVKFTGLRDGEKLYEEVLSDKENTMPTFHPKIKIARVREYDFDTVRRDTDRLVQLGETGTDEAMVREMKRVVPEYKSQHSQWERLD